MLVPSRTERKLGERLTGKRTEADLRQGRLPLQGRRLTAAALALTAVSPTLSAGTLARDDTPPIVRATVAFHAPVRVTIAGLPRATALGIAAAALEEIRAIDALVRPDRPGSAIDRLNRSGRLDGADPRLLALVVEARRWAEQTGGAFDPTVQPLWRLHAGLRPADFPVASARLAPVRALVDYRAIRIDGDTIRLERPGAGLTLNGLAQGFAADRALARARALGAERVLVDAGEFVAGLGPRPSASWRIGIHDPESRSGSERAPSGGQTPQALAGVIDLAGRAVASSAGSSWRFDAAGTVTHLFDPRSGRSPASVLGVTVVAPDAATADALSTAFMVMGPDRAQRLAAQLPGVEARFVVADGGQLLTPGWCWATTAA